jgi:CRP-like cAMP-binding protein
VIDHGPRCADVQAMEDCQLFRVSEGLLHALAGVYPAAAVKFLMSISRMLVHRLRRSNLRYIDSLLVS